MNGLSDNKQKGESFTVLSFICLKLDRELWHWKMSNCQISGYHSVFEKDVTWNLVLMELQKASRDFDLWDVYHIIFFFLVKKTMIKLFELLRKKVLVKFIWLTITLKIESKVS